MNVENIMRLIGAIRERPTKTTSWFDAHQCFAGIVAEAFPSEVVAEDGVIFRNPELLQQWLNISLQNATCLYGMRDNSAEFPIHDWRSFTEMSLSEQNAVLIGVLERFSLTGEIRWPEVKFPEERLSELG